MTSQWTTPPKTKPDARVPQGFALPDLDAPLDVDALLASIPANVRIRGMFMQSLTERCAAAQGMKLEGLGPYIAYKDYDVREHVRLLVAAAGVLHPGVPLRRAFVLLGRTAYDTMKDSLIGKVVFGVLGRDIRRITKLVGKAYEIAGSGVTAELLDMGADYSHVRLAGAMSLAESYHVGAFEGVLDICGMTGEVYVKPTATGADLFTIWWPKPA